MKGRRLRVDEFEVEPDWAGRFACRCLDIEAAADTFPNPEAAGSRCFLRQSAQFAGICCHEQRRIGNVTYGAGIWCRTTVSQGAISIVRTSGRGIVIEIGRASCRERV